MAKPTSVPGLAPDTPKGVAGPLLITARLADVRRHEGAVAERADADGVHDMRVATRRLRAALRLFGAGSRALDRELKRLQDALGEVRDVQVQLAWLAEREGGLREVERASIRAWIAAPLDRHRARLHSAVGRWSREVAAEVQAAAASHAGAGGRLGGKKMKKRLAKRTRRVARLARGVRSEPDPAAAHELRIAAKKLRYLAELLDAAFPRRVEPLLEAVVPLQDALGELHDADVRIERLRKLSRSGAPAERRGARRLLEGLAPERDRTARELVPRLDAFTRVAGAAGSARKERESATAPPRSRAAS